MTQEAPFKTVKVTIVSTLDAVYELPDVPEASIDSLITSPNLHGFTQISLLNVSSACLVLPVRIIKSIAVDGVTRWRSAL